MLLLPNGCKCSEPSVFPKNWNSNRLSKAQKQELIAQTWYISYRFYDPAHPKPKQVVVKRMNRVTDLEKRQAFTQTYLQFITDSLNQGYNPFTKETILEEGVTDIGPYTPFVQALQWAYEKIAVDKRTRKDIGNTLRPVSRAASQLHFAAQPIGEIKKKQMRLILEQCGKNSKRFSNNTYNHYKKYLSMLYNELDEVDASEFNVPLALKNKPTVKKLRTTLTKEERVMLNQHLKEKYYTFWRFIQIFYHSGARISELMQLRTFDVDLKKQRFTNLIKKGGHRQTYKTIKTIALPYWQEVLSQAQEGDYLFSGGLKPGAAAIRHDQPTKRWYRLVKKKTGVKADLYSLKHLHTSEVVDQLSTKDAAAHNSHTSEAMVVKIYDIKQADRAHERIKKLANEF